MKETFSQKISNSIKDVVSEILTKDDSSGFFFKRKRTIALSDSTKTQGPYDIYVVPMSYRVLHVEDSGTLRFPTQEGSFIIFRSPSRLAATYLISAPNSDLSTRLSDIDKLSAYFFDHRTIEPYIPEDLQKHPELYERLSSVRATLTPRDLPIDFESKPNALFCFEYSALYHSGKILREEKIVQKRVVDIAKPLNPLHERGSL